MARVAANDAAAHSGPELIRNVCWVVVQSMEYCLQDLSHNVLLCVTLKSRTGNIETIKEKVSDSFLSTFNHPRGVEQHPSHGRAAVCERLPKRCSVPPQLWHHTAFNNLNAAPE